MTVNYVITVGISGSGNPQQPDLHVRFILYTAAQGRRRHRPAIISNYTWTEGASHPTLAIPTRVENQIVNVNDIDLGM